MYMWQRDVEYGEQCVDCEEYGDGVGCERVERREFREDGVGGHGEESVGGG